MTPMFSAYVVVGEPPTEVETAVPTPSAKMARPIIGSRSVLVMAPTALTWPVFSAISAMTAGSTRMIAENLKSGAVRSGKPIHDASLTASKLTRWCVVDLAGSRVEGRDVAGRLVQHPGQGEAEDQRQQDRDAAPEAAQQHRHDEQGGHRDQGDPAVLRPVDVGDHVGQAEADQHDHAAGDGGREDLVDDPDAEEVDRQADRGEHQAGDHDRAGDQRVAVLRGPDGERHRRRTTRSSRGSSAPCPA